MKIVYDAKIIDNDKTSSKARQDVSEILAKKGYVTKYINENIANNKIDMLKNIKYCYKQLKDSLTEIENNSTILFQYPFDSLTYKYSKLIRKYAVGKRLKTIVLIHDLNSLRTASKIGKIYYKVLVKEIKFLDNFDYIIAHNPKMKDYLVREGIDNNKIIELGIFDYLITSNNNKLAKDYNIVTVAGNLAYNKATYAYKLNDLNINNYEFSLFGINYTGTESKKIKFNGSFDSTDLSKFAATGFGLVWDGIECNSCSGGFGNYLKYNNPHKISLYIASGIPVIVWKKSALASFVKENKIGFSVNSLEELDDIFDKMNEKDYKEYLKNVKKIQNQVTKGHFLDKALKKCEE